MRTFISFLKKEVMEQFKEKKIMILGLIFILFGIMNPLIAKITPWLLEMFSESLENSGINIGTIEITALDSWMQYFKNIPMLLIVYILIESSIFSKEYSKGTLILVVTKGFERYKIVLSKVLVLILIWSLGNVIYFGITYLYNDYFWDNSIASNLYFAAFSYYVFGVFVISLFSLFSIVLNNSGSILALLGGSIFIIYLISLLPKLNKYLPTLLMDGNSLIYGLKDLSFYLPSLVISFSLSMLFIVFSILLFNKKKL